MSNIFSKEALDHVARESLKNSVMNDLLKDTVAPARFFDYFEVKQTTALERKIFKECEVEQTNEIITPDSVTIEMRLKMMSIKTFTGGTDA